MYASYIILGYALLWEIGLGISVLGGHFIVDGFRTALGERYMRLPLNVNADPSTRSLPQIIMGGTERIVFTVWIGAAGLSSTIVLGMGAWIAMKLATNWRRRDVSTNKKEGEQIIRGTQLALLSGVISLAWATIVGVFIWYAVHAFNLPKLH